MSLLLFELLLSYLKPLDGLGFWYFLCVDLFSFAELVRKERKKAVKADTALAAQIRLMAANGVVRIKLNPRKITEGVH